MSQKRFNAFTLIELLIVVAIIAILAAIAVPNFLEAQIRSKVSRNKADMRSCATALESYAVDNNKYPPPWDYIPNRTAVYGSTSPQFPTGPFHSRMSGYLTTPIAYMTSLPDDPFRQTGAESLGALAPVGKRHIYYNIDYFYISTVSPPPASNLITNAEKLAGKWLFYSVGPDRTEWNAATGTTSQKVYRDYDSTNGTISYGNVFRTQASGERFGTVPYFWTTP